MGQQAVSLGVSRADIYPEARGAVGEAPRRGIRVARLSGVTPSAPRKPQPALCRRLSIAAAAARSFPPGLLRRHARQRLLRAHDAHRVAPPVEAPPPHHERLPGALAPEAPAPPCAGGTRASRPAAAAADPVPNAPSLQMPRADAVYRWLFSLAPAPAGRPYEVVSMAVPDEGTLPEDVLQAREPSAAHRSRHLCPRGDARGSAGRAPCVRMTPPSPALPARRPWLRSCGDRGRRRASSGSRTGRARP